MVLIEKAYSYRGLVCYAVRLRIFLWCLQGSNQGHMDFQSIALPSELRHLYNFEQYCLLIAGANIEAFLSYPKHFFKKMNS